jgi:O-antigen ligase
MSPASKKAKPLSENQAYTPNFIHYCFYALFFVTPLLLWPFTSEVFEFNKMLFVYAMTVIIATAWAVRSFQIKRFEIARTPLDLPLILFVTSQIASTIFSIDRHTSLWGYYSRFHGGLVSTFCYVFLFYALVTHFHRHSKALKNLIYAILATATLTAIYAVLERLGIDKNIWVQDVQNRVFSTLGQPNWLSAYLIALLPLSLFSALHTKHQAPRTIYSLLSLLFLAAILFTRSQSGIGATAIILLVFTVITLIQKKQTKVLPALALALLVILFLKSSAVIRTLQSLNKTNPFYSDTVTIVTQENETRIGGSDSMTIRRVVWQGAIDLGKKYPFFGTGVETFGYSYYWVRPAIHNLTSEDNFLYNKAHNEYLNFLATTGFFGLLTYLFLIFSIIRVIARNTAEFTRRGGWQFHSTSELDLSSPLLLGFTSILITNYFGFSVVNVALFFFLFPAIYISTLDNNKTISLRINLHQTLSTVLILALSLWLLLGVRRLWQADLAYVAGRSNLAKNIEAIKKNPSEPLYYAQLGNIQALVATQILSPQIKEMPATTSAEIKAQANSYLNQYVQEALKNTSQAVSMNKYNLNLLKTKARTELTLAQLDPKYNSDAIQTLLKITEFSPTEAINYFNVGILYTELGQNDQAKLAFQKALQLKPDYEAAKDKLSSLQGTK